MKTRNIMCFGASAFAILSSLPALSFANTDKDDDVPTVIVTGQRNPDEAAIVSQTRQKLSRTPGSVSVVANESYSNSYALGLFDTLKNVSGVFVQKKFGEDGRFSIRGSGIGNSAHNRGSWLAIDGVPLNQADGSGDFQEMDPLTARLIEVYKGGNALRFGGAQLGGAVNFVTPTGINAGFRTQLRLEGGSFGTSRAHLAYADVIRDFDIYLATTLTHSEGWRQNSEQNGKRLTLNIGRSFGDNRSLRFIYQGNDLDQRIAGGLTLNQALTTPKVTTASNYANLKFGRNVKSSRATLQANWALNANWTFDGGVYATWKELIHPISIYIDNEYQNYGAFGRFDGQGEVGHLNYDLYAGVNYRKGQTEASSFVNTNGAPSVLTGSSKQNAEAIDVFSEGRLFLNPDWALVLGTSYGWTTRDYVNKLNLTRNAQKTFSWWAPRIGLIWENPKGQQVFANITKSVEAPTFGALVQAQFQQFTPVNPQEATTYELGTRGRNARFIWDVAVYRSEIKGEMLNFIVSPDIPAATFNADKTIHQGLEAALDWKMATQGDWTATLRHAYTWSDFRFVDDKTYGNARLPIIPEHTYRLELALSSESGWRLAPSLEWTASDIWVDYKNTTKAPSFSVWSLTLSKRFNKTVEAFVEARNLNDEPYVSSVNAVTNFQTLAPSARSVFWPGEARALYFGLKIKGY
jgi:iron complex outermembrane recepter protein